ncbi:hypothetical protein BX616_002603 [Lobosporangium transversale]|nr:hypothetical protein BX616_002603 [Lobosporangium transversale]
MPKGIIYLGSLFGPERAEAWSERHQVLERCIVDNFGIRNQYIIDATYSGESYIRSWIKFANRTVSGFLRLHLWAFGGGFVKDALHIIELMSVWVPRGRPDEYSKLDR